MSPGAVHGHELLGRHHGVGAVRRLAGASELPSARVSPSSSGSVIVFIVTRKPVASSCGLPGPRGCPPRCAGRPGPRGRCSCAGRVVRPAVLVAAALVVVTQPWRTYSPPGRRWSCRSRSGPPPSTPVFCSWGASYAGARSRSGPAPPGSEEEGAASAVPAPTVMPATRPAARSATPTRFGNLMGSGTFHRRRSDRASLRAVSGARSGSTPNGATTTGVTLGARSSRTRQKPDARHPSEPGARIALPRGRGCTGAEPRGSARIGLPAGSGVHGAARFRTDRAPRGVGGARGRSPAVPHRMGPAGRVHGRSRPHGSGSPRGRGCTGAEPPWVRIRSSHGRADVVFSTSAGCSPLRRSRRSTG